MVKSQYPDVPLLHDVSLTEYVLGHAAKHGHKLAFKDGFTGEQYTYKEFVETTQRFARALYSEGIRKGDIVCFLSQNSIQYPVVFHGTIATGATLVTASATLNADELEKQLADCRATYLITSSLLLDTAKAASKIQPQIKRIYVVGEAPGYKTFADLIKDDGREFPPVKLNTKEDVAVIAYSSGTTGVPKGVMLTHFGMLSNLCQLRHPDMHIPTGTTIAFLPFSHSFGFTALVTFSIISGDFMVVLPKFDFQKYMELIEKYKANMLHIVPPIAVLLTKSPLTSRYDLTSLEVIFAAAAPMSGELTDQLEKKFPHITRIMQGYGMTEAGPGTHVLTSTKPQGSCGNLLPQTECKIVGVESGEEVRPGQAGELWVRGPQLMKGYLNRPQATAETIDPQGWLHTGDIGYHDANGYFFIVDRLKELIKYKAHQVAPADLEALLLSHQAVADAAVIGLPDTDAGELPLAFVVKKPRASITEEGIRNFVAERVSNPKKLRGGVRFIPEIPKSPTGKILRRILKTQVLSEMKAKL